MVFCNNNQEAACFIFCDSHNPYFNRWFSAIQDLRPLKSQKRHNPYFNRWFSAMRDNMLSIDNIFVKSQSLF